MSGTTADGSLIDYVCCLRISPAPQPVRNRMHTQYLKSRSVLVRSPRSRLRPSIWGTSNLPLPDAAAVASPPRRAVPPSDERQVSAAGISILPAANPSLPCRTTGGHMASAPHHDWSSTLPDFMRTCLAHSMDQTCCRALVSHLLLWPASPHQEADGWPASPGGTSLGGDSSAGGPLSLPDGDSPRTPASSRRFLDRSSVCKHLNESLVHQLLEQMMSSGEMTPCLATLQVSDQGQEDPSFHCCGCVSHWQTYDVLMIHDDTFFTVRNPERVAAVACSWAAGRAATPARSTVPRRRAASPRAAAAC